MSKKTITLPKSGATCTVRKLSIFDLIEATGQTPVAYTEGGRMTDAQKAEQVKYGVQMFKLAILRCCGSLVYPTGKRTKVVDKDLDSLGPNEMSIGELEDADAIAIRDAVMELTNVGKEVTDKVKTFPEESTGSPAASPSGEALPQAAV